MVKWRPSGDIYVIDLVPFTWSSDDPSRNPSNGVLMIARRAFRHATILLGGISMAVEPGMLHAASPETDVLAILMQDRDAAVGDQSDSDASVSSTAAVCPVVYGAAGSRRWMIGGMIASDLADEQMAYLAGGFEWFAIDDFSIGVEADLGWVGQDAGPDAGLFGLTIMMRWHFLRYQRWTMYGEIGAGLAYATEPVRPAGSRLNFTPQAGVGFSIELDHDARLLVGLGWYHLSNARTTTTNLGIDTVAVTALISIPF